MAKATIEMIRIFRRNRNNTNTVSYTHLDVYKRKILSEPYELSKIWYKMDSFVETEQMKLGELLPKILDNYKMRRVEMLSRDIDNRILESQNSKDPSQIVELLKRKNAINVIRRKLNEKLGRDVYKRQDQDHEDQSVH